MGIGGHLRPEAAVCVVRQLAAAAHPSTGVAQGAAELGSNSAHQRSLPRLRMARAACCFAASVPLRSTPTSSGIAPAEAMRLWASAELAARLPRAAAAASWAAGASRASSMRAREWMAPKRAASILLASVVWGWRRRGVEAVVGAQRKLDRHTGGRGTCGRRASWHGL